MHAYMRVNTFFTISIILSNNYITFLDDIYYLITSQSCSADITLLMGDFNFHFNKSGLDVEEFNMQASLNSHKVLMDLHIFREIC